MFESLLVSSILSAKLILSFLVFLLVLTGVTSRINLKSESNSSSSGFASENSALASSARAEVSGPFLLLRVLMTFVSCGISLISSFWRSCSLHIFSPVFYDADVQGGCFQRTEIRQVIVLEVVRRLGTVGKC